MSIGARLYVCLAVKGDVHLSVRDGSTESWDQRLWENKVDFFRLENMLSW